jgi:chromosome segregation ATPase
MEICGYNFDEFNLRWKLGWFRTEIPSEIIEQLIDYIEFNEGEPCYSCVNLEKELDDAEEAVDELNEEKEAFEKQNAELEDENECLVSKMDSLNTEISILQKENETLKYRLEMLGGNE